MRLAAFCTFIVLLSGCSSVRRAFVRENDRTQVRSEQMATDESPKVREDLHSLETALRDELDLWMDTPHVMGGLTRDGVDCSGLIYRVYADALAVQMPRTTGGMIRNGSRIRKSQLRTGDLVFFEPDKKSDHVGIYLADGEFAHTSSSQGVMVSNLSNPYWERTYRTSRRVIDDSMLVAVTTAARTRTHRAEDLQAGGK